jgi:hypothetical protein
MPGGGGLSTLRRLKLRWPLIPVLIFSMTIMQVLPYRRRVRAQVAASPSAAATAAVLAQRAALDEVQDVAVASVLRGLGQRGPL